MKVIGLIGILFLSACSSHQPKALGPFVKERDCSEKSLAYLQKKSEPKMKKYSPEEIEKRLEPTAKLVKDCFQAELNRAQKALSLNLCLVLGYDAKGKNEFFEYSTKDVELSKEFTECLAKTPRLKTLQRLKDVSILQPFRLHPSGTP